MKCNTELKQVKMHAEGLKNEELLYSQVAYLRMLCLKGSSLNFKSYWK